MSETKKDRETVQNSYLATYGEEITFDSIKRDGHYLIATKKQEKEKFLKGAGGFENERNSVVYYILDTSSQKDTKMIITSEGETEVPFMHYGKHSETKVSIYHGKDKIHDFGAFDTYIDTGDYAQVASFLSGKHLEAKYFAYSAETNKLFNAWHSAEPDEIWASVNSQTKEVYQQYKKTRDRELKKGLTVARDLFHRCEENTDMSNKLATFRNKIAHNLDKKLRTHLEEKKIAKPLKKIEKAISDKLFGKVKE